MIKIMNKEECCGCKACIASCPKKCIEMVTDNEGFEYPLVQEDACIKCGKCIKACPFITKKINTEKYEQRGYAAISLDEKVRLSSSSGGIFYHLAANILQMGGYVCGATMSVDNKSVTHIIIDKIDDLRRLQGSKYVQSNLGEIFGEVERLLKNGRLVLFSGVPCQIEALHNYLNKDYENLICVDVICHGVSSPGVWNTYISYISRKANKEISEVIFRYKIEKGAIRNGCYSSREINPYYQLYFKDLIIRPSCYSCKCKGLDKKSDITLGDFWGINEYAPEMRDGKGNSIVIINSQKGNILFDRIKLFLLVKQIDYRDYFAKHNKEIYESVKIPALREKFFSDYNSKPFNYIIKNYINSKDMGKKKVRYILGKVKRKITRRVSEDYGLLIKYDNK